MVVLRFSYSKRARLRLDRVSGSSRRGMMTKGKFDSHQKLVILVFQVFFIFPVSPLHLPRALQRLQHARTRAEQPSEKGFEKEKWYEKSCAPLVTVDSSCNEMTEQNGRISPEAPPR